MPETFRGGGSVGPSRYLGYRATWPLSSLTVDFDAITFKIFPLTYRLERQQIKYLVEDKMFAFSYLRIIHTKSGYPKSIIFSPMRFSSLRDSLHQYNYKVQTKEDVKDTDDSNVKYSNVISVISLIAAIAGILAAIYAGIISKR